ncbi:MAG: chemotaxis protein CheY [Dehalococcoidia bacterium]|nr:chemotaxis protein CheY [Dehalococcoidia bacterium]
MTEDKVLLVDDDAQLLTFVSRQLKLHGYTVELARNGSEALDQAAETLPDLIILDISMPVMDGVEALRRLREWGTMPVIVLSARDEEHLKVQALDLGADDYLTKPFSISELLARVRAHLRRTQTSAQSDSRDLPVLKGDDLEIDLNRRRVSRGSKEIPLTKTEYEILHALAINAGKTLSHRQLLQAVWGLEYGEETEYLRTFIKQLRRKLEADPARPKLILTQPGMGYRLVLADSTT